MHAIANWWDSVELWVAGLPFIPQFAVVLAAMVPVCLAIAYVLDRTLRVVLRALGRDRIAAREATVPAAAQPRRIRKEAA
ncbi:hypothetical protein [Nocardia sp. CDC160]|uniref:hypothetical protein n=1 Tax=Nocardia sp. CDC160 TaxID=3112166 RepID=UPI002DB8124A|nr:hypothetical protein [Nocardia sp. CDC160]MEC3915281.1 hypothetical protein [Nocardia sp. CDC160]